MLFIFFPSSKNQGIKTWTVKIYFLIFFHFKTPKIKPQEPQYNKLILTTKLYEN
jgi:hypothetical protein